MSPHCFSAVQAKHAAEVAKRAAMAADMRAAAAAAAAAKAAAQQAVLQEQANTRAEIEVRHEGLPACSATCKPCTQ